MISLFNYKFSPWVGLDIHADEVRLVVLRRIKQSICLEKVAVKGLMPGTIVDGKIKDSKQLLEAIKELVAVTETAFYSTVIALPSQSIITHHIQSAPSLTDKERAAEISLNLKSYFPGVVTDLAFDFAVLGVRDSSYSDILIVAVRQEQLTDYVDVVQQAGLKVKTVDIDSFALMRTLKYCYPMQQTAAIFDGKQFFVFHHQELIFSQSLVGDDFQFECIQQLKHIIQLCLSTHRYLQLECLFLCGKEFFLLEYASQIQQECGIPVKYVEPFSAMTFSNILDRHEVKALSTRMLISCGLALRGVLR